MKADDVVGAQAAQQVLVSGHRTKCLVARERHVQEKADRVGDTRVTQLRRERDQVVVVHPDDVIGLQERCQPGRKGGIDAPIALEVFRVVPDEIQQVVADRPEHLVAVTVVVLLEVTLVEVDRRIVDLAALDDLCLAGAAVRELATPAEPHTAMVAQGREHADRQTTGRAAAFFRFCHAIGNDDQSPVVVVAHAAAGWLMFTALLPRTCSSEPPH